MRNIDITAIYEPADEGGFIAYVEEIPGINSQGETLDEAKENLADAINFYFEEIRLNTSQADQNKKAIKQKLTFTL
jgi:predicted RNase H-like HicB family nuclease